MQPAESLPLTFSDRLVRAWRVYTETRVLIILLLGFSSGLPLALTGSTLSIWMADRGVDLGTIGLFALVGTPYTIKFLWAPAVDAVRIPFLTERLGRRRSWLVISQLALMAVIAGMGMIDPVAAPLAMAGAAVAVAFVSATQDVVIDAFRVESLDESQQAAGMANYVTAYRIALLTAGAGTVALVSYFETVAVAPDQVWTFAYAVMALLVCIGLAATFWASEPEAPPSVLAADAHWSERLRESLVNPFRDFMQKPHWIAILAFVVLFKFGDAFAGHMVAPFAISLGFEKAVYAGIANGVGVPAALIGGYLGGLLGRILPTWRALWVAGILQMVSNLVFCWLAYQGPDPTALTVAVAIEAVTGGIGTVIFVAFISGLCTARRFTATQFALLSALAGVGRTVLSASSGYVAETTGWVLFFVITTLAALPGLLALAWLGSRAARPEKVQSKQ